MVTYNAKQIGAVASRAGWPTDLIPLAVAVAFAESSGNPIATNHNSNGTTDYGLWQINSSHSDIIAQYGNVYDPVSNAEMALAVYRSQGWHAWSTYNSGAYKKYNTTKNNNDAKVGAANNTDYMPNSFNAQAPSIAQQAVNNVKNAVASPIEAVANALGTLTSASTWKRIGLVIGAAVLIILGVVFMIESDKNVQSVTKLAAIA